MTPDERIKSIGWMILVACFAIIYCLVVLIFMNWSIAIVGVIFGTFDLLFLTCWYITEIFQRQKELDEIESEKTWIDRALEKKI